MLAELIRYATLRAPSWARRLGLAHEHVAITYRRRRNAIAWKPHLEASKAAILEGAARCVATRLVLVIGAGDCADVPVAELAARFDLVVLTDVVLGPEMRGLARRHAGRVRAEVWDATGALAELARAGRKVTLARAEELFRDADPGNPPVGEPDLVISANCLSQLGVVPLARLSVAAEDEAAALRCAAAAAQRHLRWLAARGGVRVLLADRARLDVAPDGREVRREIVPGLDSLRTPDRTWRWDIAPIPELSPAFSRVHEVGAWIDGMF